MKTAYTCFTTDTIHAGHLNIIAEAKKLADKVIVGCLSDKAIAGYNRIVSTISEQERVKLYKTIPGVSDVVIQNDVFYNDVITLIQPSYILHGDNWKNGSMAFIREYVADRLAEYGGEIVDVPYTTNEEVYKIDLRRKERLSMPEFRRKRLRRLLEMTPIVIIMEAHSGLSGMIVEKTVVQYNGKLDQFDGMWISSLCDSAMRGKPDIELVDITSRLKTVEDIMEVTTKPIVFDGNTGGMTKHFEYTVRSLERLGVSAVVIEDGIKNGRIDNYYEMDIAPIDGFSDKIAAGKKSQLTEDFMIIARIDSLVSGKGLEDALKRAAAYVKAGADGIMINGKNQAFDVILDFCDLFKKEHPQTPIVLMPAESESFTEKELYSHGIKMLIYPNQLMRSAVPAMQSAAEEILRTNSTKKIEESLIPTEDIISLVSDI